MILTPVLGEPWFVLVMMFVAFMVGLNLGRRR
jgi:hypothetical protein